MRAVIPTSPDDTIAAVSTPPGEGGIGIVRVSGPEAVTVVKRVFVSSRGRDIASGEREVYHGEVRDGDGVFDEVLVHVMRAPHTYTREDVVEVNCHGGAGSVQAVLELLLREGARLADPGEFTRRAFLNGRIDLVQAEAVIDRIRARTQAGLRAASAAGRGTLSKSIHAIRDALVVAKSHIEAAIDFPDQDLPDLITPELRESIFSARDQMRDLLSTADAGRLLREGAAIAITGRPNVGKSSLFNALLRETRAIVTPEAGTTRDVLQETITLEGIPVCLTDMAGVRESEDAVERMGVDVARRAFGEAALILFVVDASEEVHADDLSLLEELGRLETPVALVMNKCDLEERIDADGFDADFVWTGRVSATGGSGLKELEDGLASLLRGGREIVPDRAMITRLHQKDSLRRALDAVERVEANFEQSPEFMGIELADALKALGEITGETTPDEILEHIFADFCLGK